MSSATESSEGQERTDFAPSPDAVRAALAKILASPGFVHADRISRFLRYTVEESLAGHTDKLKESVLGVEVFGRKPTYDPRVDAVVRTEAVKLRGRLREYYETEGRLDPLHIDLPKGGYVATFHAHSEPMAEPERAVPLEPPAAVQRFSGPWLAIAIVAALVLAGGLAYWLAHRGRRSGRPGEITSIVVLPFADLSAQRDQEYFCDGITEEVIDELSKIKGLRVVARTSSFAFKGKGQDVRDIGRILNVDAVLEGSVRKSGDRLRITAQLNSVADGYHLWSETYERELKDVFAVQDSIARAIVDTLQPQLTSGHPMERARAATEDIQTYDLYLKGRYHWSRWRTDGAEKAISYFEQAIARDRQYAPAYAGLADSYTWLGFFGALPPRQAMPKARTAATEALRLDDSLAAAHASLGYVKALYEFDWPAARREFERAIQLNPGFAGGHFAYAICYLTPLGRFGEAETEMKTALDLDPLSIATNTYLGLIYHLEGKNEAAVEQYRKALELEPNSFEPRADLATTYGDTHRLKEFYAELAKAEPNAPRARWELARAVGLAQEGKRDEALAVAHKWENASAGSYVRPTSILMVYLALGDRDGIIRSLQKSYDERDGMIVYLKRTMAPRYRADPEIAKILDKIGPAA